MARLKSGWSRICILDTDEVVKQTRAWLGDIANANGTESSDEVKNKTNKIVGALTLSTNF